MKFVFSFIVTVVMAISFAGSAQATRPVSGYNYKDECKNIAGKQPVYMTVGSGPYRKNEATARPNDCYKITVSK